MRVAVLCCLVLVLIRFLEHSYHCKEAAYSCRQGFMSLFGLQPAHAQSHSLETALGLMGDTASAAEPKPRQTGLPQANDSQTLKGITG